MNEDIPNHNPEEIEARITALLLGELTLAEEAEVRRAIESDADLARLHERLKRAIELVREAVAQPAGAAVAQQSLEHLSEERRQKLLQRFKTVTPKEVNSPGRRGVPWLVSMSIAAILMALLTLGGLLVSWEGFRDYGPKALPFLPTLAKTALSDTAEAEVRRRSVADARGESANRSLGLERLRTSGIVPQMESLNRKPAATIYLPGQSDAAKPLEPAQAVRLQEESGKNEPAKPTPLTPLSMNRYSTRTASDAKNETGSRLGVPLDTRPIPENPPVIVSSFATGPPSSVRGQSVTDNAAAAAQPNSLTVAPSTTFNLGDAAKLGWMFTTPPPDQPLRTGSLPLSQTDPQQNFSRAAPSTAAWGDYDNNGELARQLFSLAAPSPAPPKGAVEFEAREPDRNGSRSLEASVARVDALDVQSKTESFGLQDGIVSRGASPNRTAMPETARKLREENLETSKEKSTVYAAAGGIEVGRPVQDQNLIQANEVETPALATFSPSAPVLPANAVPGPVEIAELSLDESVLKAQTAPPAGGTSDSRLAERSKADNSKQEGLAQSVSAAKPSEGLNAGSSSTQEEAPRPFFMEPRMMARNSGEKMPSGSPGAQAGGRAVSLEKMSEEKGAVAAPTINAIADQATARNGPEELARLNREQEQIGGLPVAGRTLKRTEESVDFDNDGALSFERKNGRQLREPEKDKLSEQRLAEVELKVDRLASSTNGVATPRSVRQNAIDTVAAVALPGEGIIKSNDKVNQSALREKKPDQAENRLALSNETTTQDNTRALREKRRELDELVRLRDNQSLRANSDKAVAAVPRSNVKIVDLASVEPEKSPTLWERIRGTLAGDVERVARIEVGKDTSKVAQNLSVFDPYFIQTEFETIMSKTVLYKVIEKLNLNQAWAEKYGNGDKLKNEQTYLLLKRCVEVRQFRDKDLVEIRVKSDKPEEAARIANTIAEVYRVVREDRENQRRQLNVQSWNHELSEQEKKIAHAKEELEHLQRESSNQADVSPAKLVAPAAVPQPEVPTQENAFSTFSLNVTDVSFKLAAASLEKGALPEPATVRSEEFINAFNYRDPEPAPGVPVAFAWERAQYPYAHNRELIRFAIRTAARGREAGRPLNLVLLLDNSGSMERADRVRIIREALVVLARQLQPQDRISVVAFARTARLWVDALAGNQAGELAERVGNLPPEGGTNLEEALNLAYATAARHFLSEGVNRVVLLTDGAANLGDVDPESLRRKVESWRQRGVALDCFGIGWEGYNDNLLEVLSRNGDGRYGFVNTPEEATTEFAAQLAGALRVAASDVKVQVEFNPGRVAVWRQIGYAKHQLTKEQFRDNTVDAAELAAAESGNALFVTEVNPNGVGPIGVMRVRYREPDSGIYREHEWPVPYIGSALPLDHAGASLRLAATASAFSEWLASSPFAGEVTPDRLLNDLQGVPAAFEPDPRPQKLEWMIRQAKSLSGK